MVVSVLDFYSGDPSSNPVEVNIFVYFLLKRTKISKKRQGLGPIRICTFLKRIWRQKFSRLFNNPSPKNFRSKVAVLFWKTLCPFLNGPTPWLNAQYSRVMKPLRKKSGCWVLNFKSFVFKTTVAYFGGICASYCWSPPTVLYFRNCLNFTIISLFDQFFTKMDSIPRSGLTPT